MRNMPFLRTVSLQKLFFFYQVRTKFRLTGVYPTVVTPFKPLNNGYAVDFDRFDRMLTHLNRYPVAGFALLGTAGECASVGYDPKLELVTHARKYLGNNRIILAGAGLESTYDTIELIRKMSKKGADACFVYNPTYFRDRMDNEAYLEHFRKIADQSPVPIILYNIPTHIDVEIPIDVIVDLAKHRNIVGLLDTSSDITRIATICKRTSRDNCDGKPFDVMAGSAGFFLPGLIVGCQGVICSLANILPLELNNLQELVHEHQMERALQLQWRLLEPNEAITTKYGVAGLKAVIKSHIGLDTGSVRAPLRNLTEQETEKCVKIFQKNGFLLNKKKTDQKHDDQLIN